MGRVCKKTRYLWSKNRQEFIQLANDFKIKIFIDKQSNINSILCLKKDNYEFFKSIYVSLDSLKELALYTIECQEDDTVIIINRCLWERLLYKVIFTKESWIQNYIPAVNWVNYTTCMQTLVKKEQDMIGKVVAGELTKYAVIINRYNKAIQIRSAPSLFIKSKKTIENGKKILLKDIEDGGLCSNKIWTCHPSGLILKYIDNIWKLLKKSNLTFRNKIKSIWFDADKNQLTTDQLGDLLRYIHGLGVKQLQVWNLTISQENSINNEENNCILNLQDWQWVWIIGTKVYTIKFKSSNNILNLNIINSDSITEDYCIIAKVIKLELNDLNITFIPNERGRSKKWIRKLLLNCQSEQEMYIVFNQKNITKIEIPIESLKNSSELSKLKNIWVEFEINITDNIYIFKTLKSLPKHCILSINIHEDLGNILFENEFWRVLSQFLKVILKKYDKNQEYTQIEVHYYQRIYEVEKCKLTLEETKVRKSIEDIIVKTIPN